MRLSPSYALLAATLGALSACFVQLDTDASVCGDAYVDALVGEACEPGPGSCPGFCEGLGLKPRESGACNGQCKCDESACDLCGDGKLDPGEECELGDLNGGTCPGDGTPTCRADCKLDYASCDPCGNGKLDVDEECDPQMEPEDVAIDEMSCRDLVSPGGVSRRYGSGVARKCTRECLWDRSSCSYCNNNQLDGEVAVDFDGKIKLAAETCDNGVADAGELEQHCKEVCGSNYRVACNYKCSTDCRDFDDFAVPTEDLACCTVRGEQCPYQTGSGVLLPNRQPCCWALTHPDDPDGPCQEIVSLGGQQISVCR